MMNIRRLFNICLVALMWIITSVLFSAITIPSGVSDPAAVAQLQHTAEVFHNGSMALIGILWAVVFAAVSIPALVRTHSR